jgi:hypothetical protein
MAEDRKADAAAAIVRDGIEVSFQAEVAKQLPQLAEDERHGLALALQRVAEALRPARMYVFGSYGGERQFAESATSICSLSSAIPRSQATGVRSGPTQQSVLTICRSTFSFLHKPSLTTNRAPGQCRPRSNATAGYFMRPEALAALVSGWGTLTKIWRVDGSSSSHRVHSWELRPITRSRLQRKR